MTRNSLRLICNIGGTAPVLFDKEEYLDYTNEIHTWVKITESCFAPHRDLFMGAEEVTKREREILINWLIVVQVQFKLLPETLFITVNIIDRYLSQEYITLEKFQLLGVAAMSIASKFQEIYPPLMVDFLEMTSNTYRIDQMRAMEYKVLHVIQFDVNCTPSQTFLENYSRALGVSDQRVLVYASYLLDLALIKAEFLRFKTSEVSLCALEIAMLRESRLSKLDFSAEFDYMRKVKEMEQIDTRTYQEIVRLYKKSTSTIFGQAESQIFTSLVLKYSTTEVVSFTSKTIQNVKESLTNQN